MSDTSSPSSGASTVDPKLLEILVCPVTKTSLEFDRDKAELISKKAGLAFPIRNGIPIMLVDEARVLED
ncbi:MAG: Trm112 family protein [Sneathiellales bacterium]|nr:Trm112 family protein [Sneathiellales bacterium]